MNTETQPREWTPERLARETVLSWRGKLSNPETFEYLYEIILRAINTAIAAEQKLRQSVERDIVLLNEMVSREKEQLRQQLAAEREKVKSLVDALERIIMAKNIEVARGIVNDALAKIKEYKKCA